MARQMLADIVAGLTLGVLTGLLTGLTTASVTSTVLTTVLAVATAFFGLAGSTKLTAGALNHARIISFALAMIVTLPVSIWIRTHDTLSPTSEQLVSELKRLGFEDNRIQQVVMRMKYGMVAEGVKVIDTPGSTHSTLYAGIPDFCSDFAQRRSGTVDEQMAWLAKQGPHWQSLAEKIMHLPPERREKIGQAALFYICGVE